MALAAPTATTQPRPRRPELTSVQKQNILRAAGELIRATIFNETPNIADPTLGGSADQKRTRHALHPAAVSSPLLAWRRCTT